MADSEEAKIVKDVMHKVAKENDIKNYELTIKPISSGGANYMSHLYVGTYTKQEGKEDNMNVFAKIAATGEKLRQRCNVNLYHTEIHFYNSISTKYRGLEALYGVQNEDKLNLPKFYGYHKDLYQETVVLENLMSRGFGMYDRMKSVDWEYAAAAMRELAKFHALSVAYQRADPRAFEEDEARLKNGFSTEEMHTFWNNAMKKTIEKVHPEHKAVVQRFLDNGFLDVTAYHKFTATSKQKMLIHGDYRPSNMMHRTLENGTVELIPVDFQTMQAGSPVQDFIYFMVCATDEEFRKQYYDRMVDYYCDRLQEALARLKLDSSVYSKQDFLDELKERLPFGLAFAFFLLPIVTVDEDKAPVVNEDLDITSIFVQDTSALFVERLNGIVNDYRRWGILS